MAAGLFFTYLRIQAFDFFTKPHILKHFLIIIPLLLPFRESARTTTLPAENHQIAAVDVYRMAAILEAEAIGEPYKCQCLVGQVWLNRGKSNEGFARKKPTQRAIKLARKILTLEHGHKLKYFLNPRTATDKKQLRRSRGWNVRCGGHVFW